MKTSILLVILAGLFFAPSAKAQTTSGKLKELCELNEVTGHDKSSAADNYRAGVCMGYIIGYIDSLVCTGSSVAADGGVYTLKLSAAVTAGQVSRVFLAYIAKHPEDENDVAASSLSIALMESHLLTSTYVGPNPKKAAKK